MLMVTINKDYLEKVKQELVDHVEGSSFIVPELLYSISDIPNPTSFVLEFHKDKLERKIARRKKLTVATNSDDVLRSIREYQEEELMEFIKFFPKFKELVINE